MKVRMQSSFDLSYWSHEMEIVALLFRTTAMLNRGHLVKALISSVEFGVHSSIERKGVELGSKMHYRITLLEDLVCSQ